jgi:magnesium-transporting ATPase (P-type)
MYTALPIMFVAVFDKMLPMQFLQDNPQLYKQQKHKAFDPLIFSGWVFRAFLHAVLIYFLPYAGMGMTGVFGDAGRAEGMWFFTTTVYYCTVMTPTLLILFDMANVTFLHWLSIVCSVAALYLVTWIMNYQLHRA